MKKVLWIGDALCQSGFGRATDNILPYVSEHYDVTVLALNYTGDPPHPKYSVYPASPGGDVFGVGRLLFIMELVKPDVVVIQNDPWNIPAYVQRLKTAYERMTAMGMKDVDYLRVPIVAVTAVDGENFKKENLDGVERVVFWTDFGRDQARASGALSQLFDVIPLGVDLNTFFPLLKQAARTTRGLPDDLKDVFIVGNVNRNQLRKHLDLTIEYFAEWVKSHDIRDAYLYLHVAPTGDRDGVDCMQLARYYGVQKYLILREPEVRYGDTDESMNLAYNCFDVLISTSTHEGFSLPTFEALACGVPVIVPNHSAFKDLLNDSAAFKVDCPARAVTVGGCNVIGYVADKDQTMSALNVLYDNRDVRERMSIAALELARRPRYRWETIGKQYVKLLDEVLAPGKVYAYNEKGTLCKAPTK